MTLNCQTVQQLAWRDTLLQRPLASSYPTFFWDGNKEVVRHYDQSVHGTSQSNYHIYFCGENLE